MSKIKAKENVLPPDDKKISMTGLDKRLPPTPSDSPCPLPEKFTKLTLPDMTHQGSPISYEARQLPPHPEVNTADDSMTIKPKPENSMKREPLLPPILTSARPPSKLPLSSASPNFDFITKLPTPIVGTPSSTFPQFQASPPRYGNEELDIRKRSQQHQHQHHQAQGLGQAPFKPNRVISEYRPSLVADTSAYKLQQVIGDHKSNTGRATAGKRFISNPHTDDIVKSEGLKGEAKTDQGEAKEAQQSELNASAIQQAGPLYTGFIHNQISYKYIRQIGTGLFSKVILAENVDTKEPIAIKIIEVPHRNKDEVKNFKSFIERELRILFQLHHPNIISLIDYNVNLKIDLTSNNEIDEEEIDMNATSAGEEINDEEFSSISDLNNKQFMFLKYCKGGNLFEFLLKYYADNQLKLQFWKVIEKIVIELLAAVGYLHLRNVIHRDIKLENILLNYDATELLGESGCKFDEELICLADFGLSKKVLLPDELLETRCGSEDYISPELLMGLHYNGQLTDSWSIGVVVYALLENRLPFDLPPISANSGAAGNGASGVSPSVLKRQRNRNRTPHRIAMIDWGWFKVLDLLSEPNLDAESKEIIKRLQSLVDVLLVRKQNRMKALEVRASDDFAWVRDDK